MFSCSHVFCPRSILSLHGPAVHEVAAFCEELDIPSVELSIAFECAQFWEAQNEPTRALKLYRRVLSLSPKHVHGGRCTFIAHAVSLLRVALAAEDPAPLLQMVLDFCAQLSDGMTNDIDFRRIVDEARKAKMRIADSLSRIELPDSVSTEENVA